jgi:hypothetical protein
MCKWVIRVFTLAYVAALILLAVGMFGLFGQTTDPLSGVFLVPLGLPWNMLVDLTPESMWPWLTAAAPIINILLLRWLCRRFAYR